MRRFLLFAMLVCLSVLPVLAQEPTSWFDRLFGATEDAEEDPGGYLEQLLEDNLSSEDRTVEITGFAGALSGKATLDTLTISDREGEWLTLNDVTLDWNRAALLRGRIEVAELSAKSILLPRQPLPAESQLPAPEATGFQLPELPVSVTIEKLLAERVEIGASVYGEQTLAAVSGSLDLSGGEGKAELLIDRLDYDGQLKLDASFRNSDNQLDLSLSLNEGADGVMANALNLPGRPSVSFDITGSGTLDAFSARIGLATDSVQRLTGTIETIPSDDQSRLRVLTDISGDIAPLFAPDYKAFFGNQISLKSEVSIPEIGGFSLESLALTSEALELKGQAIFAAGGLPTFVDLSGQIEDRGAGSVLLPLAGTPTSVDRVDLNVAFNAVESDQWSGRFQIAGLDRAGFSAEELSLTATGRIQSGVTRGVTAALTFDATRLNLRDTDADEALGERVTGGMNLTWEETQPLQLSQLRIDGETYSLTGESALTFSSDGPNAVGEVEVQISDLAAFSGLAGRRLGGGAQFRSDFDASPFAGFYDLEVQGSTQDLFLSLPELDRVLEGSAEIELDAARDESGISFDLDRLESPNAKLTGMARLRSKGSAVSLTGSLSDVGLVVPELTGAAVLEFDGSETDGIWFWSTKASLPTARLDAEGTAANVFAVPVVSAGGTLASDDLSLFSGFAGRPLSGSINTRFSGDLVADQSRGSLNLEGTSTGLGLGIAQLDSFVASDVTHSLDAAFANDVVTVRSLQLVSEDASIDFNGLLSRTAGNFSVSGQLASASRVLVNAPDAPLTLEAVGNRADDDWTVKAIVESSFANASFDGTARSPFTSDRALEGKFNASADDLSVFQLLAGRPISGTVDASAEGSLQLDLAKFSGTATLFGSDLSTGLAELDKLLAGNLSAEIAATRNGTAILVEEGSLTTNMVALSVEGELGPVDSQVALSATLSNVGVFAPGLNGPLTASGTIRQTDSAMLGVNIEAVGPGGSTARIQGSTASDFSNVNLDVRGSAPLGLTNRFILPRSLSGTANFDLRVDGPPRLASVSGRVEANGARFVDPDLAISLDDLSLTADIAQGAANVAASGNFGGGGRVEMSGRVGLIGSLDSDIAIALRSLTLTDPRLYQTTLNGNLSVVGPLSGGARISGRIDLGETNIRIPSTGLGGAGEIPDVIHINEPPPVRGTRRRAGLLDASQNGKASSGRSAYPLDIFVSTPNQIFVRGRGLDSEFGGSLRITGTTANVVPIGAFNLIRGRLDILGRRLDIEDATISLQGSFTPVIRIVATTAADDVTVRVVVSGPATNPDIGFTSEPELPEEEVLARLLFGRELQTLSPFQAAQLALAVRTLAGRGGEGLVGEVRRKTGLADLDVTSDGNGGTAVRAGAYLNENIYTDITVGSDGESELNLNLDLTPSVRLKGSASNSGETSIGIFYEKDY